MEFTQSERSIEIRERVVDFMNRHVYPVNKHYLEVAHSDNRNDPEALAFVDDLRAQVKELGLWNLFFPHLRDDEPGTGLTNFEFAPICEEIAKLPWAYEVFNCNAPVTGNMMISQSSSVTPSSMRSGMSETTRTRWRAFY